uniref:Protein kinase domain-containing protein n=1 Tax=Panagrolaimus sp. ES5 TaxID=591445 RepID=A0AC34GLK0_9BILA
MAEERIYNSTVLPSRNGAVQVITPEKYQPQRVINEGSQGIVIEAWDQINARRLAIKKLKDVFAAQGGVKQCYREFVLGAAVQHDN